MNSILVTGARGFAGSYLCRLCKAVALQSNVCDFSALKQEIGALKPDFVIHLAAQSHVPSSLEYPDDTHKVNVIGTQNLIRALRESGFQGRMLYVSSSDVYGNAIALPICETDACNPLNPYALSKVEAEKACLQESNFDIIIARPFNHIGIGQKEHFVIPTFVKQLAAIKKGVKPAVVRVGNLDSARDFCDVRDIVRGYMALLEKGTPFEVYNLCSSQSHQMSDLLKKLIDLSGLQVEIVRDEALVRHKEQKNVRGSFEKIYKHLGWKPEIPLDQSLRDIWEGQ